MIRRAVILVAVLPACWGCEARRTEPRFEGTWTPGRTTGIRVRVEPLGEVPNSGLQLPAVSPDGRWIAYLRHDGDQAVRPEDLFAARRLEAMSLHVRAAAAGAGSRLVCESGAAWPAWSGDGKTLVFVACDKSGRCRLGLFQPEAGTVRYLQPAPGPVIMMPALSRHGRQVAFVSLGPDSRPRLHVLTVQSGKLQSCPGPAESARALWPHWTADGRVVHVRVRNGSAWLAQWTPGAAGPRRIRPVHVTDTPLGAYQCFSGLGRPLSPDDTRLAYYDASRDRIVLVDLRDGAATDLPERTRSGCWTGPARFAAANDEELMLVGPRARPVRMLRGAWLPRAAVGDTGEVILCGRGSHRFSFALVRLRILSAG